jgi:hypothetical protein
MRLGSFPPAALLMLTFVGHLPSLAHGPQGFPFVLIIHQHMDWTIQHSLPPNVSQSSSKTPNSIVLTLASLLFSLRLVLPSNFRCQER